MILGRVPPPSPSLHHWVEGIHRGRILRIALRGYVSPPPSPSPSTIIILCTEDSDDESEEDNSEETDSGDECIRAHFSSLFFFSPPPFLFYFFYFVFLLNFFDTKAMPNGIKENGLYEDIPQVKHGPISFSPPPLFSEFF